MILFSLNATDPSGAKASPDFYAQTLLPKAARTKWGRRWGVSCSGINLQIQH